MATLTPSVRAGGARLGIVAAVAVLALAVAVWLARHPGQRASGTGGGKAVVGSVVRFADRNYEGSVWTKKYAAANLGDLPALGIRAAKLDQIIGTDDDRVWVVDRKGVVFRRSDGHWELAANQPDVSRPVIGVIDRDTILLGGRWRSSLYLVQAHGVRPLEGESAQMLVARHVVTPVAPDLSYIHTGRQTLRLLEGKLTLVSPGDQKDSIVVDEFGAPVTVARGRVMTPNDFAYTATFAPGEVYAIWMNSIYGVRLVEYRDGAWVMLEELSIPGRETSSLTAGWIGRDAEGKLFAVFGGAATAVVYRQGDGVTRYPIGVVSGASLGAPIAAWGTGPERFYLMDASGSIWERSNDRWRPIVRGLLDQKLAFNDAWVGPQGQIYAITDDALYQLE